MTDLSALLLYPFLACCIFVAMHAWLGLHVLRRKVVFADLALAQLSALGGTVAVAAGHSASGPAAFGWALAFTLGGAGLLTATRSVPARVGQEAVTGILYVVASATTVLVVDRSPQGAEHVRRMLVGDILTVGSADVAKLALLYGLVAAVHALCRRPLLAAAHESTTGRAPATTKLWDFVFYATFGLVVTSSVALAGVLLVFSFLIIPAVIGLSVSDRMGVALCVGWGAGIVASGLGFGASVVFDAPTGAAMVATFAVVLLVALALRFLFGTPGTARRNLRRAAVLAAAALALAILAQAVWLMIQPAGDQPLLALVENGTGFGPERFLTAAERRVFQEAAETERRHRAEVERLRGLEREARWSGRGLREDELRRVASFQQTFNEMGRGERFVQDHLRALARSRERWVVGVPAAALSGVGLVVLFLHWRAREIRRNAKAETRT
jgi:zinc/manganese transport system permease protein